MSTVVSGLKSGGLAPQTMFLEICIVSPADLPLSPQWLARSQSTARHAFPRPHTTHRCFQNVLKIIIDESSGLIIDFAHITQVKSDERLAEFALIFLKKKNKYKNKKPE